MTTTAASLRRLKRFVVGPQFIYLMYGAIWILELRLSVHVPLHGDVIDVSVIDASIRPVKVASATAIGNQGSLWTEVAGNIL